MTDRPILFSAPMVCALLDGRKTQTRRVAKFVSPDGDGWHIHNSGGGMLGADDDAVRVSGPDYAPFAVGDRLWVKETWRTLQKWDDLKPSHVMDDVDKIDYAADGFPRNKLWAWGKTRVSIFMPRWASRLTLLMTNVRVERLKEISEGDCYAEGLERPTGPRLGSDVTARDNGRNWYRELWNNINGAGAWEANPWVVAVSFDVRKGNIDG